jgi:hypothetical protein
MAIPYDLAAEERAKRRYYFLAIPVWLVSIYPAIAIGFRFLPAHFRDWPALTVGVGGLSVAQAWAAKQGWRVVIRELVLAAVFAGLWVWWRGSLG